MVSTAPRAMILPTTVEPVNEILEMCGLRVISAPTTSPQTRDDVEDTRRQSGLIQALGQ